MSTSEPEGYVLVGISQTDTVERLLPTAIDIARDRSCGIMLRHVVRVPPQLPLTSGDEVIDEEDEEILELATAHVEEASIPVDASIRYARSVANGIVSVAEERDVDLILMGWHGRPPRRDIILGSYLDEVLRKTPCDVLVKRLTSSRPEKISSVLVAVAPGGHNELAVDLGGSIARCHDADMTLAHVVDPETAKTTHDEVTTLLDTAGARLDAVEVSTQVFEHEDIAEALIDATAEFDVTLLGATEQSVIRRKLVGTVAASVGRDGHGEIMIAQRKSPAEE